MSMYNDADKARRVGTDERDWRSPFWRDYARVLHSPSLRRLQAKTQVFPAAQSDYIRTRLTHSLEVEQIARSIVRFINSKLDGNEHKIDEDLVATAALAHDIGHPPFGHAAERAIDKCMLAAFGELKDRLDVSDGGGAEHWRFEANAQNFRVLAKLEKKEGDAGLNLCNRTIAAIMKYPKKLTADPDEPKGVYLEHWEEFAAIREGVLDDQANDETKTLECSIMDIADDIAYAAHDIDDAFKYRVVDAHSMKSDLLPVFFELTRKHRASALQQISDIDAFALSLHSDARTRMALTSSLITEFVLDVRVKWKPDCLAASQAGMSEQKTLLLKRVRKFTVAKIYKSKTATIADDNAVKIVSDLWRACFENPCLIDSDILAANALPHDIKRGWTEKKWAQTEDGSKIHARKAASVARAAADFIGSMTDTYARRFHAKLFAAHPPPTLM